MAELTNELPQSGEDVVPNEQENPADTSVRIKNRVSMDGSDQIVPAAVEPRNSFPKGDMITMGHEESVSVVTDTNASGNTGSLDSAIAGSSGPPSNIIQQFDDDSEQLINLDSIQDSERESDASDSNGIIAERDDNKNSWLNIDSSSTSQGSQGSYAHQVPALLGSYGSNGMNVNQQPNDKLLPPQHHFPEKPISEHSRSSNFQNLEKPQSSGNLEYILGPKGVQLESDLGPNGEPLQSGESLQSDLDDILGPQTDGKPSDLDDTLGPYYGSTVGPSLVPPSGQRHITTQAPLSQSASKVLERAVEDIGISEKQNLQVQSQNISSVSKDSLESKSTLESEGKYYSHTSRSSVGVTSGSSYGDIIDEQTTQGDDTLSSNNQSSMWDASDGGTLSPNSHSRKTERTSSSHTSRSHIYSLGREQSIQTGVSASSRENSSDRVDRFSDTEHTSGTPYTSVGSRGRIYPFSTEESSQSSPTKRSQFSHTEHTTDTQVFSITSMNAIQASPSKHSRHSRTEHTTGTANAICSIDESEGFNGSEGGRMWREAELQAASSKDRPLSPRAKKFAESIMLRTRSRADPNALLNNSSNIEAIEKPTRSMINVNNQEEGGFVQSTMIAKKRGRIVQLLTIGLLSFLISFLGGILVLSSCYFVSASIQDQENAQEYNLHFGLWRYSPSASASQGYNYCTRYDGDFIAGAPWFGRLSGLVAILGGGFSFWVLCLYLVLGRSVKNTWNIAVYTAAVSGLLQLSTLSIFSGAVCKQQVCTLGPAGVISIVAGCFYFVLAFEMYYNTPLVNRSNSLPNVSCCDEPHQVVANLEMTDFENGAKAYIQRILNQSHNGETTKGRENSSYVPPIV